MLQTSKNSLGLHADFLNFVRPSEHSTYSPSAAERWLLTGCPFSVKACENIPSESSVYSEEGTAAHSACEALFYERYYGIPFPNETLLELSKWDSAEIMQCAEGYVNVLEYWINNKEQIGDIVYMGLEKGVPIFPELSCFGTSDAVIIGTKGAAIIDYKHGKGKNVDASSLQLKVYLAGVYKYLQNIPQGYTFYSVVYQPRIDSSFKEHNYLARDLSEFLDLIHKSILKSKEQGLEPVEGNHCYWCPARRTKDPKLKCPAIKGKAEIVAKENFGKFLADMNAPVDNLVDPNHKRDEALIKIMTIFPMMERIVKDADEEFKMRLSAGENIPGIRLIDKFGSRVLNVENDKEAVEILNKHFPKLDPLKVIPETKKLKTITEIEKEIGKNKLDPFCVKKVTKQVDILDTKAQAILKDLHSFSEMLANGDKQQE